MLYYIISYYIILYYIILLWIPPSFPDFNAVLIPAPGTMNEMAFSFEIEVGILSYCRFGVPKAEFMENILNTVVSETR